MQAVEQVSIPGADLRRLREDAGTSASAVARAWGCTPSNIQLIEGAARVTADRAAHYREALARVGVVEASRAISKAAAAVLALESGLVTRPAALVVDPPAARLWRFRDDPLCGVIARVSLAIARRDLAGAASLEAPLPGDQVAVPGRRRQPHTAGQPSTGSSSAQPAGGETSAPRRRQAKLRGVG